MPLLLLLLLLPAQKAQGSPRAPETRDQLCGRHLLRALVRVCGGPRWSREAAEPATGGEREWGASEHLRHLPWLVADGDPALGPDLQLLSPTLQQDRRSRREAQAPSPAQHCCLSGCSHQDLLSLCPR
nr:insulin-like 3 [Cavia porcellus]